MSTGAARMLAETPRAQARVSGNRNYFDREIATTRNPLVLYKLLGSDRDRKEQPNRRATSRNESPRVTRY